MRPRLTGHASVLLAVSALLLAVAPAEAARRSSLAGNVLIEDKDDVFAFPHLILDYDNLVAFDYGAAAGQGNGVILFGTPNMAFGLAAHRGDTTGPLPIPVDQGLLGGPPNPLGAFDTPLTVVDLLFASGNDSGRFGARLALGTSADAAKPDKAADGSAGKESSKSQTYIMIDAGYGLKKPGMRLDAAASLFFDTASQVVEDEDSLSGTRFGLSASVRGYMPQAGKMDLGFLGTLGYGSGSVSHDLDDPKFEESESFLGVVGGAGPVYHVTEDTTIAAYGTLSFVTTDTEPNDQTDNDESSSTVVVLPGVNIAADIQVIDWLWFRSGLDYYFALTSATRGKDESSRRVGAFGWSAGLGIEVDDFKLDGSLQHNWITAGPTILGGGGDMFGIVSASYAF